MYKNKFLYTKFIPHFSERMKLLQINTKVDNHAIKRGSNEPMLVREDDKNQEDCRSP